MRTLNYDDFVQMVRTDMLCGAAPDEYPTDEKVKRIARQYYIKYLQGASVDEIF